MFKHCQTSGLTPFDCLFSRRRPACLNFLQTLDKKVSVNARLNQGLFGLPVVEEPNPTVLGYFSHRLGFNVPRSMKAHPGVPRIAGFLTYFWSLLC